jgi:hypothetical protein
LARKNLLIWSWGAEATPVEEVHRRIRIGRRKSLLGGSRDLTATKKRKLRA